MTSNDRDHNTADDPLLDQLESDCEDLLANHGQADLSQVARVTALQSKLTIHLWREAMTRDECNRRRSTSETPTPPRYLNIDISWRALGALASVAGALFGILWRVFSG